MPDLALPRAAPAGTAALPTCPQLAPAGKGWARNQRHGLHHKLASQRKPTSGPSFALADVWPKTAVITIPIPILMPLLALFPAWETVPGAGSGICQPGRPAADNVL